MATIALIPGAWHTSAAFEPLVSRLRASGHTTVPIALPSVGATPAEPSMDADTAAVRAAIEPLVEAGKDVVAVVHSYGSLPTCNAIKGLAKKDRQAAGKKGGVSQLVYLSAFVIPEGGTVLDALGGRDLPWFETDHSTGYVLPATPHDVFYNDLSQDEAQSWVDKLESFSYGCFKSPVEYEAYKDIPSTFLVCETDRALPLVVQEDMIQSAKGAFHIEKLNCGHSPFLSNVDETVAVIERAIKGQGKNVPLDVMGTDGEPVEDPKLRQREGGMLA